MNTDIVDQAVRILRAQPARMLALPELLERLCRQLGIALSSTRLLRILQEHADRFTLLRPGDRLLEGWRMADVERYAPALEHAGLLAGPTVLLTTPADAGDGEHAPATPFDALLEDVHRSVADLLHTDGSEAHRLRLADALAGLAAQRPPLPRRHS